MASAERGQRRQDRRGQVESPGASDTGFCRAVESRVTAKTPVLRNSNLKHRAREILKEKLSFGEACSRIFSHCRTRKDVILGLSLLGVQGASTQAKLTANIEELKNSTYSSAEKVDGINLLPIPVSSGISEFETLFSSGNVGEAFSDLDSVELAAAMLSS